MIRCRYVLCHNLSPITLAFAVACGGENVSGPCPPDAPGSGPGVSVRLGMEGVTDLPDPLLITAGNSIHLMTMVTSRDECGIEVLGEMAEDVTWTISQPDLATVYGNGIVHTKGAGLVTVSATVGAGTASQRLQIAPLGAVPAMSTLVTGAMQSCAIGTDGTLFCWGDGIPHLCNDAADGIACGSDYTTGPLATPDYPLFWATCAFAPQHWSEPGVYVTDYPCSRVPSHYTVGVKFSAVDANGGSTVSRVAVCGLTDEGTIHCAGSAGPLVALDAAASFTAISVGAEHACALDETGRIFCWGSNRYGALGDSTTEHHDDPRPVHGDVEFTALDAAYHLTCALSADGRAYCWGASYSGQLGAAELESCGGFWFGTPCSLVPQPVSDTTFQQITVGGTSLLDAHVCGLGANGTAYCWGGNYDGSLGDGTRDSRSEPTAVGGDLRFQSISAGGSHTCGITTDGEPYCWGSNLAGELGHPGIASALLPEPVIGAPPLQTISAGGAHTCGLTTDGLVYCWGFNETGELGNGTIPNQDVPTRIAGQE